MHHSLKVDIFTIKLQYLLLTKKNYYQTADRMCVLDCVQVFQQSFGHVDHLEAYSMLYTVHSVSAL